MFVALSADLHSLSAEVRPAAVGGVVAPIELWHSRTIGVRNAGMSCGAATDQPPAVQRPVTKGCH